MNIVATIVESGFTQAAFDSFLEGREETTWVGELRRRYWQQFLETTWPERRSEEWMRTDIRLFKPEKFQLPTVRDDSPLKQEQVSNALGHGVDLGGKIVTIDGRTVSEHLDPAYQSQGVFFGSLARFCQEQPELAQKHLFQVIDPEYDRFALLHAACWTGGAVLYVPRGVVLDKPLHTACALSEGAMDSGHTLVILEDDAEATLLCEAASDSATGSGLHCGGTEVVVGNQARLRLVNLQDWGNGVWHFAHQRATVGRDARLQWTIAALGSRLAKVNQHVALVEPGAECQVNGVMFTEGKQHLAYNTLQHHRAPHCHSDFLYKSALQDKSRTVWRGMIKVDPGAQRTDGYQRNDNLLLSQAARADSIPGLEIEADDVRCTHGSTSGRVDEELIFYARCRGFTRREAIQMIVTGFFQQIFDRITIESVREALGLAIAKRVREYE